MGGRPDQRSHDHAFGPLAARTAGSAVSHREWRPGGARRSVPTSVGPAVGGRVDGEQIICPYHGMRFGVDGACTLVPTQNTVPQELRSRATHFERAEPSSGSGWATRPGSRTTNHPSTSPTPPIPSGRSCRATTTWACNWVLIRENVLDLTHIPHLHEATFKQNDWDAVPKASIDGDASPTRSPSTQHR